MRDSEAGYFCIPLMRSITLPLCKTTTVGIASIDPRSGVTSLGKAVQGVHSTWATATCAGRCATASAKTLRSCSVQYLQLGLCEVRWMTASGCFARNWGRSIGASDSTTPGCSCESRSRYAATKHPTFARQASRMVSHCRCAAMSIWRAWLSAFVEAWAR